MNDRRINGGGTGAVTTVKQVLACGSDPDQGEADELTRMLIGYTNDGDHRATIVHAKFVIANQPHVAYLMLVDLVRRAAKQN